MTFKSFFVLALFCAGSGARAQVRTFEQNPEFHVTVREVTSEYDSDEKSGITAAPTPPPLIDPLPPLPNPLPAPGPGPGPVVGPPPPSEVTLSNVVALGTRIWDFIVNNKPNATYENFKASVVPAGITNWTQLQGWSKPVSKVYRVEFTNILGRSGGSFDYRITFIYGGHYRGKGKYIGQISFVPATIQLGTDRSLKLKAELLDPLNFGTEEDPVAGAALQISWSSPTTPRYQMGSVDLFLYGTGEIQNLSDGN